MATCTKCGKLNYEGVKYCTACGTPLAGGGNFDDSQDQNEVEEPKIAKTTSQPEKQTSRPRAGINKRVIYIGLGVILLIALIFFIRYLLSLSSNEIKVKFEKRPAEIFVGTEVTFEDKTEGAVTWEWDFGDDGIEEAHERIVYHTYEYAGDYIVKLIVNGEFIDSLLVSVKDLVVAPVEDDPDVIISGPTEFYVGDQVQFFDNTPGATQFEWKFGETGLVDATSNPAVYVFREVNRNAQVSVRNNVSKRTGILSVNVKRKKVAPSPGPNPPKNKPISENEVLNLCNQLVKNGPDPMDAFQKVKDKLACGDGSIPVKIKEGNTERTKALKSFFDNLGFKNQVISVKFIKDAEGCLIGMEVELK